MKLAGKVAIITGAGQGIGECTARRFAGEGASVVVGDINLEAATGVARDIQEAGGTALAVKADVSNKVEVEGLVNSALASFKSIHILVNNAGIVRHAPLLQMTEEDWDIVHDINLKGTFLCTQAVLGHMVRQRYGKIINISSIVATGALSETRANYASSKAGVIQLTKATAREAGPHGINVNVIAPGLIITPMVLKGRTEEEVEQFIQEWARQTALKRAGKPEDIASLALFLASDESSYVTGQVICCDGGHHDRF